MVARTPRAQVRGLGSAKSGAADYWRMKLTSYALLPLTVFLIGLAIALARADHATAAATLAAPYVAIPLLFFILINALHMRLGMDQIIEDYVHAKAWKMAAAAANVFFSWGVAATAVFALLRLSLGVGG
jgi:succinate dehydrogenase / fumarate reductase, membrane anchor subunit